MCLAIIPLLGAVVGLLWTIVAFVVAVRQGLDFTTGKAIGTMLVGLFVYVVFWFLMGMFFMGARMVTG
jgi:hypothetical protein